MQTLLSFPDLYLAKWGFLLVLFFGVLVYGWWYKRWLNRIAITKSHKDQAHAFHHQLRARNLQSSAILLFILSLTIWVDYRSLPRESTPAPQPVTNASPDPATESSSSEPEAVSSLTPPSFDALSEEDVLSLYAPAAGEPAAPDALDMLKSDLEQLLIANYILRHCDAIDAGKETAVHQAFYRYLLSHKDMVEPYGTSVDALADNIAVAALGSFQLRFQQQSCDIMPTKEMTKQLNEWLNSAKTNQNLKPTG